MSPAARGLLGVSLNNDTSAHLVWAEGLRSDLMAELYPLPGGYPLAPHALMAALAAVTGIAMDEVLNGLLIATAALTALAAWPLLARLPVAARIVGAALVTFAYLSAAYYAQGAFKETMMALFVVAFVAVLAEARGTRRPWLEVGVPAGLCVAGGVQVYSYLALGWFVAIAAAWLVLELALGGRRDVAAPRARGAAGRVARPSSRRRLIVVAGLASQVDRLVEFAGLFSVSPAGSGARHPRRTSWQSGRPALALRGARDLAEPRLPLPAGERVPRGRAAVVALIVVVVGAVVALRRREAVLVGAVAATLAIYWVSDRTQSPYLAAKALALAAPLVMALALGAWPARAARYGARSRGSRCSPSSCSARRTRPASRCAPPPWPRRSRSASSTRCAGRSGTSRRCSSAATTTSPGCCAGSTRHSADRRVATADRGGAAAREDPDDQRARSTSTRSPGRPSTGSRT